jgi:hypothetical protein
MTGRRVIARAARFGDQASENRVSPASSKARRDLERTHLVILWNEAIQSGFPLASAFQKGKKPPSGSPRTVFGLPSFESRSGAIFVSTDAQVFR